MQRCLVRPMSMQVMPLGTRPECYVHTMTLWSHPAPTLGHVGAVPCRAWPTRHSWHIRMRRCTQDTCLLRELRIGNAMVGCTSFA